MEGGEGVGDEGVMVREGGWWLSLSTIAYKSLLCEFLLHNNLLTRPGSFLLFLSNAINSFSEDLRAACCSWAGSSHETGDVCNMACRPSASGI